MIGLAVGITGPGSYSIDALFGLALPFWLCIFVLMLALTVLAVGLVTSARRVSEHRAI